MYNMGVKETKKYQKVAWQNHLSKATYENDVDNKICPDMLYYSIICTHTGKTYNTNIFNIFLSFIFFKCISFAYFFN